MKTKFIILFFALLFFCGSLWAQDSGRSGSIVTIEGQQYYVHTVLKDQTVYSLSRLYNVTESELQRNNPHIAEGLQAGMVIKTPYNRKGEKELNRRQMRRTFDTHTVRSKETLYAISRNYGISVNTLLEDNEGLDPAKISDGQKLNIRKDSQGDTSNWQITEEFEEYRDALNSVTENGQFYLVKSKDTLYSLAKIFGTTVESIEAVNDMRDGLKAGVLIKIPGKSIASLQPQKDPNNGRQPGSIKDSTAAVKQHEKWSERRVNIKDISARRRVNISMLLPLEDDRGEVNMRFVEFYRGAMLALEDLKEQGMSANIQVYNTSRSERAVVDIVGSAEFQSTDLIIGPVYEDGLLPIITFAETNGVPIISPLQQFESVPSPVLYQMSPAQKTKYDKLKQMVARPDVNVIYLTTNYPDREMDAAMLNSLPPGAKTIAYTGGLTGSALENRFEKRAKENIFIVSCTNLSTVDQILGKISSVHNNLTARSLTSSTVRVIGNSRWARFSTSTVDRELYFKLGVCYVTNYHADRTNVKVRELDRRYMATFGETAPIASPYLYRGYDAVKLFAGAAMTRGEDYTWKVNGTNQVLLQVAYHMVQDPSSGDYRNANWVVVCYNPDYTITVH